MNFDFNANKETQESMLEKKATMTKILHTSKINIFKQGLKMSLSLNNIPSAVWSVAGLILAVVAMYNKIDYAAWCIPVACLLNYAAKQALPFAVMSIALAGMALGIPQLVFLLIFAVITMVKWSEVM